MREKSQRIRHLLVEREGELSLSALHHFHRPVIVAMIAVGMMQAPIDQVIRVVTVRHGFMPAVRTVDMFAVVPARCRLAAVGVGGVHHQRVLVKMSFMRVMQMAVNLRLKKRSGTASRSVSLKSPLGRVKSRPGSQ
jgi:hypothetical protein